MLTVKKKTIHCKINLRGIFSFSGTSADSFGKKISSPVEFFQRFKLDALFLGVAISAKMS